jgi:hypothetical protein
MPDFKNINEELVQSLWNEQRFFDFELKATDGRALQVLKPGQWNHDEGPDFAGAEILVNGKLLTGDVEIHVRSSQWYDHKHHLDSRYNRAVLHVVFWDDDINLRTRTQNGNRIPTLELSHRLDTPLVELIDEFMNPEAKQVECRITGRRLKIEPLKSVFDQLGQERLIANKEAMRALRVSVDFEQLLYGGIMDALGFSQNRESFRELAQRVPIAQLMGKSNEAIQAILLGVAGLLPSQSSLPHPSEAETPFVSRLESLWASSAQYENSNRMSADVWRFGNTRPPNFPTRRIAAMAMLISSRTDSLMAEFVSHIEAAATTNKRGLQRIRRELCELLMLPAIGYWASHSRFGKGIAKKGTVFIGKDRASEIIINKLLPLALVWAEESQSSKLSDAVQKLYDHHPKIEGDTTTKKIAAQIFTKQQPIQSISPSAKKQQGAIYLHKNFCSSQLCELCPILNSGGVDENIPAKP